MLKILVTRSYRLSAYAIALLLIPISLGCAAAPSAGGSMTLEPFHLDTGLESRSISFENRTGARGAGGKAASPLGQGRKGAPAQAIMPGGTVELCDIEGPGTIRHIWMTTLYTKPEPFREAVIRAYWEGQEHPSIEVPLGDFAGFAHGKPTAYQSAVHSVGENAGMNFWLPMPFAKRARLTLTNEGTEPMALFYQIDYTIGDKHEGDGADGIGRLHALFRRENPTTLKEDFVLMPERRGKGRFMGALIGVRVEDKKWWGEGEIKFFMDGDMERDEPFATIVGTGTEDYVGLSFGMQETPFAYHGANLNRDGFISMYRWHIPDPIYWNESCRVTIQQIGHKGESPDPREYYNQLYERSDDWSTATFWYEPIPSAPLPAMPDVEARMKNVWRDEDHSEE